MLILSEPTFRNMIPIGSKRSDGTFDLWYIHRDSLAASARGLCKLYRDEHNDSRAEVGLRPLTISELKADVTRSLGQNKVAVLVYIENDEAVYLYNHDGTLYFATGLVEQ